MPSIKPNKILIALVAIVLVVSAVSAATILMNGGSAKSTPAANFKADKTSGLAPLTVQFTDLSTGSPNQWLWDFGDGTRSTEKNPAHIYTTPGSFTVSLWCANANGNDTHAVVSLISVAAASPAASFSATPVSGAAPLVVSFTDLSSNAPTSWSWDFNNDGTGDSTEQNPEHTYAAAGTYTVKLTATNDMGSDTKIKTNYIVVASPIGDFLYSSDEASVTITGYKGLGGTVVIPETIAGLPVKSIGNSGFAGKTGLTSIVIPDGVTTVGDNAFQGCTGLTSMTFEGNAPTTGSSWADGVPSTMIVNYHQGATGFTNPWKGFACLPILTTPVADFSAAPRSGSAPLAVSFTDLSSNAPTSWSWDFGDGGTSTEQNPEHTYNAPGTYTVKLTATNVAGKDDEIRSGHIVVTLTPTPVDQFSYYIEGGKVIITGYNGPGGDVIIPGTIEGLPVTNIGSSAFLDRTALTSIVIPDSVTQIRDAAFSGCTSLNSVTIPDSVTSISYDAFRDCTALTSVHVGRGITYLGTVFAGCISLTSVIIPNSVTYISGTFLGCTSLTSVTIPDSVTNIESAFQGCTALASVTIPNSVTTIGSYAFAGCTSLTSVMIPNSVTSIKLSAFQGCTSLTSMHIGSGVTSIDNDAFRGCASLTSVTIPDSVTSIGSTVFSGCTSLTSVHIGSGVTNLITVFSGCTSLTSVIIPNGVTYISDAFQGCTALASVTIPNSVIGMDGAFRDCTALTSVTIGNGITTISKRAFLGCTSLTSMVIPESVTSIDNYAFQGCTALTSMTFKGNAPSVDSGWATNVPSTMVVYYHQGATGFTNPWQGYATVMLTP